MEVIMSSLFENRNNKVTRAKTVDAAVLSNSTVSIPDNMWEKCNACGQIVYVQDLNDNSRVCPSCSYHFRLTAMERLELTLDTNSFIEYNKEFDCKDPLEFPGYLDKVKQLREKTGLNDAVVTGTGTITGLPAVFAFMDSQFLMGSMGSSVGEKITQAFEMATEKRLPIIIFTVSGGARMQEGIISLMQMAKVSGAAARHSNAGLLYVTVLTDPTTGGVTASFAMQGDIIISEPGALIGFAGKRVIEQTIKQSLPEGFQTAEFLMQKGFIDNIVERKNMRKVLHSILEIHKNVNNKGNREESV